MMYGPNEETDLKFDPWSVKEKAADLRPGTRLDAIVARHYLGLIVLQRQPVEPGRPIYASRMPGWWLKDLDGAEGMVVGIPPYSACDFDSLVEGMTDAMMLLDFAHNYEISAYTNGTEVEVGVWFDTAPREGLDPNERIVGRGRAFETDFAQAYRPYGHLKASQIVGLAICRAVMDAVHEMSDEDYQLHLDNVRQSIIRMLRRRREEATS
jgi:hypothetical protein